MDEGSILDQKYEEQISWNLIIKDLKFQKLLTKCMFTEKQHITTKNS